MAFALALPTPSPSSFVGSVKSESHPSLPVQATISRNTFCSAIKAYNHSSPSECSFYLGQVISAANSYLPQLLALASGLSKFPVTLTEQVDVSPLQEFKSSWRSAINQPRIPSRKPPRFKTSGLDTEVMFSLSVFATLHYVHARILMQELYNNLIEISSQPPEKTATSISAISKLLLTSSSIYRYAASQSAIYVLNEGPLDISHSILTALENFTFAEATLLSVLKDDVYLHLALAQRDSTDKSWMIGAPKIPKVRAHLFARICVAAAERVARALGEVESTKKFVRGQTISEDFVEYLQNLRMVAMAKMCRFLAVDCEADGCTGKAVGWLKVGLSEIQYPYHSYTSRSESKWSKASAVRSTFQHERREKKEGRKLGDFGNKASDAGRLDEGLTIDLLLSRWERLNDTINTQRISTAAELMSTIPSGRDCHIVNEWIPMTIDSDTLANMRNMPTQKDSFHTRAELQYGDSEDEEVDLGLTTQSGKHYY